MAKKESSESIMETKEKRNAATFHAKAKYRTSLPDCTRISFTSAHVTQFKGIAKCWVVHDETKLFEPQ